MIVNKEDNGQISICLSNDEGIVFFDWLSRLENLENTEIFKTKIEQTLLWDIETSMEKVMIETFMENYDNLVKAARERLKFAQG